MSKPPRVQRPKPSEQQEDDRRWSEYLRTGRFISQEHMLALLEQLKQGKRVRWPK